MTTSPRTIGALFVALIVASILSSPARSQIIFADNFNVTGGNSTTTGFGTDGVNQDLNGRLSGSAFAANPGMQLLPVTGGKSATAYSIVNNAFNVAPSGMPGATQYSADGVNAFNYGSFLEGKTYEIRLNLSNADPDAGAIRTSFYIADSSAPPAGVMGANLVFQLVTNATSMGNETIFKRLSTASSPTGAAVNLAISAGYPFGQPIDFRLVINDSSDYTAGVFASSYELFANSVSVNTGTFRFNNPDRFIVFDTAGQSGPATYDNFQVGIVPEPSSSFLTLAGVSVLGILRRSRQNGQG
jgi:hypothetical protein